MIHAHVEVVRNSKIAMEGASNIEIASFIEYTLLAQQANKPAIEKLCQEAIDAGFFGVCVPPFFVQAAAQYLAATSLSVITVAGFPFGYSTMQAKAEETRKALVDGADEVDMVMNISAFRSGQLTYVQDEIQRLATLCHMHGKLLKVIIETAILDNDDISIACSLCAEGEADFVKTSTGFAGGGATEEIIRFIKSVLPSQVRIKASGGINDRNFAQRLIEAGASRIGSSAGLAIIEE
ncbi:MAG: deoxyribose-phosphate aldolase [Bacteroidota bacterium]|nr:deoxyribose-phosphate aldolase [Bacteroidota bacterium]